MRPPFLILALGLTCAAVAACAGVSGNAQVPHDISEGLARKEPQDVLVTLDDSAIKTQAAQLRKTKGIAFDDPDILSFKAERYAALKRKLLAALPVGEVDVLRNYDLLPIILLRVRSPGALKVLLAQPSVLSVSVDREESPMVRNPRP